MNYRGSEQTRRTRQLLGVTDRIRPQVEAKHDKWRVNIVLHLVVDQVGNEV